MIGCRSIAPASSLLVNSHFSIRLLVNLIPLILAFANLTGQSIDTLKALQDFEIGQQLYHQDRNYDSALIYYNRAAGLYQKAKIKPRQAIALLKTAYSAHRARNYSLAETYYNQALDLYESIYPTDNLELAAPNQGLGSLYAVTGNYYQALIHTKTALDLKSKFLGDQHIETAVLQYNIGTAYMNYGEYENSMNAYQKALTLFLKHHGEVHRRLSSLYVNMGILFDKKGEPGKALDYYHKSVDIDLELYGESYYLLAYNYYNMAISYLNLKKSTLAEAYYKKTIEHGTINNLAELQATAHYGLGNIALDQGDLQKAMKLYQQAIQLFIESYGSDFPGINHSYRAMAKALTKMNAYDRAMEYLNQTVDLLRRNFGDYHPFLASTYLQIASLYRAQGAYKDAMNSIDQGLVALSKRSGLEGKVSPDSYSDQYVLLSLVREQALILKQRYYRDGSDLTDLKEALKTLEKAIAYIDHIRRGYSLDESKLLLQEEAMSTYEQAITTAKGLYEATNDAEYLALAFQFIEKSKAVQLMESLHGDNLQHIQGVPDSVLNNELDLRRKIRFTESLATDDHIALDSLSHQLFSLKRSYDTLAKVIEHRFPQYYDLKYGVEVIGLKAVQEDLQPEEAVLTYFIGDEQWFVFALSASSAIVYEVDTIMRSEINLFRDMVTNPDVIWSDSLSYNLYHLLVKFPLEKLKSSATQLIIVPDGPLGHLPFDAFLTEVPATKAVKKPYLVYDYAISYTPSLTLLLNQGNDPIRGNYTGFAPVDYQNAVDGVSYPSLPESQNEVHQANALFGGEIFVKKQATIGNLRKVGSTGILHLATHGLVDDHDPMQSKLLFSSNQEFHDDGALTASEIYNMQLNSNLAILSACNTGFGEIKRGEGIMNLSRAFQYAGSPNIIMSLWQVSDYSTSLIIRSFLENVKSGNAMDISLQKAKMSFLRTADPYQAHPAYWASFVFLGNNQFMKFRQNTWAWYVIGGLLVLAIVWVSIGIKTKRYQ